MNDLKSQLQGGGRPRYRERDAAIPCDPASFPEILEHLADVYFYVNDVNSRWQGCNSAALTLFNAAQKTDVLGKTDWDFCPEQIAKEIIQDDRSVIECGAPDRQQARDHCGRDRPPAVGPDHEGSGSQQGRAGLWRDRAHAAGRHDRHAIAVFLRRQATKLENCRVK